MTRTVSELAAYVDGGVAGDGTRQIQSVAALGTAGPADLTYADDKFAASVLQSRAGCIFVSGGNYPGQTVVVVKHPKLAFAKAAALLVSEPEPVRGIHAAAIVAPDADLATNVSIGAFCVVGSRVHVGAGTVIESGCRIGDGVRVGTDCRIRANTVLYAGVTLGDRLIIHSGAVIGADGFGFVDDGQKYTKFPQAGTVVIGDDVEIGANTTIDRGSLGTTRVGTGTKIDNLCQIAHNVEIGQHCVIAAQTGISGSTVIGDRAVIGGQVGIGDHCRIDAGAILASGCGVPTGKRIRAGEIYWGTPARPLKDIKIQQALISRLPKLAAQVAQLRRSAVERGEHNTSYE